jgi:MFS transporter, DHA1 family, multidrug resistance protein
MSFLVFEDRSGPGQREFVWLIATIMMIVAFAIDSMLPALPSIGRSLGVAIENDRQYVISAFLFGFGISQFFVGTLSDRYGRRGLMLWSLAAFAVTNVAAAFAPSFPMLLAARVAQGLGAAGARVLVTSVVRDRFEGRAMAKVMSLASVIFMAAPVLAPTMGQMVLTVAPWRWIFGVLALIGVVIWVWVLFRLPESLAPADQVQINPAQIRHSFARVLGDRQSVGYTLALTSMSGALMGFILSVQQVFSDIFGRLDLLPYAFAISASGMAAASLTNSAIVMRYGMRRIGHAALILFTLVGGVHALAAWLGYESITVFVALQTLAMMGFAFAVGNFGAMAMEHVGDVAGTASSLQGSFSTVIGALLGTFIGQHFDGTTVPLYLGYFLCGIVALIAVFVTEGGSLFVARNAPLVAGG